MTTKIRQAARSLRGAGCVPGRSSTRMSGKLARRGALLLLAASASYPALAQAQAAASSDSSEIIVTATKRDAVSVQQIPLTVQAVSGVQLTKIGALEFNDFYRLVPGISVFDNGPSDKRYVIRGVASAGAGTVGVYLDDVVITGENSQDGGGQQFDVPLYDIQRVEALKGPQGTTFGSSSMAGTLRYITNKPDTNQWSETASVTARQTEGGDFGPVVDASVNIPVVKDKFAIRVAGYYENSPGWINSTFEKGVNTQKTQSYRVSAKWNITDRLTLSGMYMYEDTHLDGRSYITGADYSGTPLTQKNFQPILAREPFEERANIFNGVLEYRPDYGVFTFTASKFDRNLTYSRDASLAAQAYLGLADNGAGRSTLTQPKTRTVNSYEARFSSHWNSPLQLLSGLYYQDESRHFRSFWPTANTQGYQQADPTLFLDRTVDDKIKEFAAYTELTYHITDKLQVIAAGRYYHISMHEESDAIVSFGGGVGAGAGTPQNYKDSGLIGRANISYDFSPTFKVYAQVAQGYRSGGTNDMTSAEIAHVSIPAGYASDSLINYEAGVKTSWFDKRLFIDGALYHIDWSNIQLQNQATDGSASFPYTGNGGKAEVDGVEATVEVHPIHGLQLGATVNYNYARLVKDNPIASTGVSGNLLPYVPRTTASISADYSWPLGWREMEAHAGGSVTYTSHTATELNASISDYRVLKGYSLVNLHVGVTKDNWSLTATVNNLFNDTTIVSYVEVIEGLYPDAYITNRPRTVSLTLSAKF